VSVFIKSFLVSSVRRFYFGEGAFRPFKVIQGHWYWCQSKARIWLPISPNSNFGPILHRFRARTRFMCHLPHPYSTLILGVFPLHQIALVGRQPEQRPQAIRPWNYFWRIPSYVLLIPKRHGQTDGQTDRRLTVASPRSALASRGKKSRLRRFKSDLDKMWQDCSSSKCASIEGVGFMIW